MNTSLEINMADNKDFDELMPNSTLTYREAENAKNAAEVLRIAHEKFADMMSTNTALTIREANEQRERKVLSDAHILSAEKCSGKETRKKKEDGGDEMMNTRDKPY